MHTARNAPFLHLFPHKHPLPHTHHLHPWIYWGLFYTNSPPLGKPAFPRMIQMRFWRVLKVRFIQMTKVCRHSQKLAWRGPKGPSRPMPCPCAPYPLHTLCTWWVGGTGLKHPPRTFPPSGTTYMPNFIKIHPVVWISIESKHIHCPPSRGPWEGQIKKTKNTGLLKFHFREIVF